MNQVGRVLYYSPRDINGFWINETVASCLNEKDMERMRSGYRLQAYNSRGVYTVDTSGEQERSIADKYRHQAAETEKAGYQRFADMLKGLANTYDREAEEVILTHSKEYEEMRDY